MEEEFSTAWWSGEIPIKKSPVKIKWHLSGGKTWISLLLLRAFSFAGGNASPRGGHMHHQRRPLLPGAARWPLHARVGWRGGPGHWARMSDSDGRKLAVRWGDRARGRPVPTGAGPLLAVSTAPSALGLVGRKQLQSLFFTAGRFATACNGLTWNACCWAAPTVVMSPGSILTWPQSWCATIGRTQPSWSLIRSSFTTANCNRMRPQRWFFALSAFSRDFCFYRWGYFSRLMGEKISFRKAFSLSVVWSAFNLARLSKQQLSADLHRDSRQRASGSQQPFLFQSSRGGGSRTGSGPLAGLRTGLLWRGHHHALPQTGGEDPRALGQHVRGRSDQGRLGGRVPRWVVDLSRAICMCKTLPEYIRFRLKIVI